MKTLSHILSTIERCSAISLADHKCILVFDAQSEFFISDLVNSQGDRPWNAINIDTGKLTRNVPYEGGQGLFYDSVLFFTNKNCDCTIVRLPEVGVAIQFAIHCDNMLASKSEASQISSYQYYLDFRKDGAADGPWTRFLDEWKALPTKFA